MAATTFNMAVWITDVYISIHSALGVFSNCSPDVRTPKKSVEIQKSLIESFKSQTSQAVFLRNCDFFSQKYTILYIFKLLLVVFKNGNPAVQRIRNQCVYCTPTVLHDYQDFYFGIISQQTSYSRCHQNRSIITLRNPISAFALPPSFITSFHIDLQLLKTKKNNCT